MPRIANNLFIVQFPLFCVGVGVTGFKTFAEQGDGSAGTLYPGDVRHRLWFPR